MWEMFSENRCTEDGDNYTAYGIRKEKYSLSDVSADRQAVENLVDMLNRNGASTINAADIAEDYIAEL